MNRSDWLKWKEAIDAEYQQMIDDAVYKIVDKSKIPKNSKIIGTMLILKLKRTINDEIDKYKARLVALGNQQTNDTYEKIKSPTARSSTCKMLISIQAKLSLKSRVIDIKGAYLKPVMKKYKNKNIYIKLPDGRFALLEKYLYGLKQS